ncbi:DUF4139 domain-containing protein [Kitasatospora sp. NPDC054939]
MDDSNDGTGGTDSTTDAESTTRTDTRSTGTPSVLDSVVVYATGAVCCRRARVTVPAGGRVRLTGLPRQLDGRSLRARVLDGPAGAAVSEARLEPVAVLRSPAELPELRRELEEAGEREEALRERLVRLREAIADTAALQAVPPPARPDDPHRRTPADAWLELAEFVDERLAALHARDRELVRELERAEHASAVLADRYRRASTADRGEPVETSATALLTVTGAGEGAELDLELEYGVPAARWVPAYRLAYRQGEDTGRLVLRASVAQLTGEDWTGVRLALSTADLQRRTDLPKLRSLRIGRSQPAPAPSGWREPPSGLTDLFGGFDAVGSRPAPRPRAATTGRASLDRPGRPGGPAPKRASSPAARARRGGSLAEQADTAPAPFLQGSPPLPPAPGAAQPYAAPSAPQAPGGFGGYGGPPPPPMQVPVAPVAAAAPRMALQGFAGAPAPAPYQPSPPAFHQPPAGPPVPDAALLDYPALVLAGPEQSAARRGRLQPPAPRAAGPDAVLDLPLPRHCVPPRVSAGSFDHRFDAAAPADIPSDAGWHTVTVAEIPVSLSPEYVTVPSVEEKVYGTLVIANRTAQAVLAGPVEVTVDGEFLLTAALPTLAPGGVRRLGLGVTEAVEVARRTELRESTAGMLSSSTVLDHKVHVELANRLARPVTVEVRERVPVASEADIRIEERADWRAPDEPSSEVPASTRLWRVELPPGGRAELHGGFEIRIPAGKAIVGGNRRN